MSCKQTWSPERDFALMSLRAHGEGWTAIAAALGLTRNAVMERARRVGARLPPRPKTVRLSRAERHRPPLSAGHPTAWSVLVAGTLLDGEPYTPPEPVPRRERPERSPWC